MEKRQTLLATLLLLGVVACFLPWLKMDAAIVGEEPIERDIYGYDYIVPLGAPYTAPVAILNVIGFILSVYSFKRIQRIRMLNVVAGILILVGVVASFGYTTTVAFADIAGKGGSFHASGDYGMGLEALLGLLIIITGALKSKASFRKVFEAELDRARKRSRSKGRVEQGLCLKTGVWSIQTMIVVGKS